MIPRTYLLLLFLLFLSLTGLRAQTCPTLAVESVTCAADQDSFFVEFSVVGTGEFEWTEVRSGISDAYDPDATYTAGPFPSNNSVSLAVLETTTGCATDPVRVEPPAACSRLGECSQFTFSSVPVGAALCDTDRPLLFSLSRISDFTYELVNETGNVVESGSHTGVQDFSLPAQAYGRYRLIVTRAADNCAAETEVFVGLNCGCADFLVSYQSSGIPCLGETGRIDVQVFSTVTEQQVSSGFTYRWSTGDTTSFLPVALPRVTYTVTVTETASGCRAINRVEHISDASGDFRRRLRSEGDCDGENITLTAPAPYDTMSVTWTQELTGVTLTGPVANFTTSGNITISVADTAATGCLFETTYFYEDRTAEQRELTFIPFEILRDDCRQVGCLKLTGSLTPVIFGEVGLDYQTPDGPGQFPLTLADVIAGGAELCDPAPGLHRLIFTDDCGSDTLSIFVPERIATEACGNVSGSVYTNATADCNRSAEDYGVPQVVLEFTRAADDLTFYGVTGDGGDYQTYLPEGTYTLRVFNGPDGTRLTGCAVTTGIVVSAEENTVTDVALEVVEACPQLNTDISLVRIRRCFENSFTVSYENRGTATATDAAVLLTPDAFMDDLTVTTAGLSAQLTPEGNILVPVGDLPPFSSGTINFSYVLNCEAELGQAHCLASELIPDAGCSPANRWAGALLRVDAAGCMGDSLRFEIRNTGLAPTSAPVSYVITEDGVMLRPPGSTLTTLAAGGVFTVALPANGSTYHVFAEQEPGAPASALPGDVQEGCGTNADGGFSTGFTNVFAPGNGFANETKLCRENIGSYDPNEKLGFPRGLGAEQDIEPGTRLRYELHFQNTGTDTAFTVVVRDTLPEDLDVCTVKFGTASHPYEVRIDSGRVLTFVFNNILLPDSTTNLAGSQGVVNFTIDHVDGLLRGHRLANRAGIYFDFNEPIITEYSRHRLAPEVILSDTDDPGLVTGIRLSAYPNPAREELTVQLPEGIPAEKLRYRVHDLTGREVLSTAAVPGAQRLRIRTLPPGYYLLSLTTDNGRVLAVRKLVKR